MKWKTKKRRRPPVHPVTVRFVGGANLGLPDKPPSGAVEESVAGFHNRLKMMGYPSYGHFLRSAHWKSMVRRFKADRCALCGREDGLDLHHRRYDNLGSEWAAPHHLITVCRRHHQQIHGYAKRHGCTVAKASTVIIARHNAQQERKRKKLEKGNKPSWREAEGVAQLVRAKLDL